TGKLVWVSDKYAKLTAPQYQPHAVSRSYLNISPLPPTPPAPFPFDFEFFVVAIPLNVPGIILVPDNRNIFSF
ncbi:hypothetical protein NSP53_23950, partial [Salmonella enterica]|nr:hypothetical protein [Salmonella enterica]